MTKTEIIKTYCKQLNLASLSNEIDSIIIDAQKNEISYVEFVKNIMEKEVIHRKEKDKERRTKYARLPLSYNLDLS